VSARQDPDPAARMSMRRQIDRHHIGFALDEKNLRFSIRGN